MNASERRKIRGWIERTDRLVENHRRIGLRWQALGVDGLLDRIIRDAEDLDTVMNGFLDNLRAHQAALDLLDELVEENRGPHLSRTTLRDRWVLEFANGLHGGYSDIRTAEELRAIAERFKGELAAKEHSHIEWLVMLGRELREAIERSAATVGASGREVGREGGCVFRRKWNTDFGGSGTSISEEVEHRFRDVEHRFRDVEHPFRGKWNAGSGVVNARR